VPDGIQIAGQLRQRAEIRLALPFSVIVGASRCAQPEFASDARVRVVAYDHALNSGAAVSAGSFAISSGSVAVGDEGPVALGLARPVPNPTAGTAWLTFSLPAEGPMQLEILDLAGRRVWHAGGRMRAGTQTWVWDGRGDDGYAGAGLYFVRLTTPWGTRRERLVRLR